MSDEKLTARIKKLEEDYEQMREFVNKLWASMKIAEKDIDRAWTNISAVTKVVLGADNAPTNH